ncbi:Rieske 2Fe-2S domain-containing protein [Nonomuraea sp. KC401]|uniref:Cytochrome bc1 complex Rieske iron-sulfur subunit n=1 Tax=Nonomuraea longispora TaxID=1848320 RepID=A0A4R4MIP8_9ACTN|nr:MULTISPECIES: Rieske (2Fe-2S) protein [Nonomuraea]NBE99440.1 Rieske 2Fe-2S domain-containing protein [Nonomuraea sp. K271]TDB95658.1 iron-sulfur protein [Nonomuraea longispora]TLF57348.1 Rieske 2Fe-2S domain-containing protein [Nonomuraea sp. KC401]
MGNDLQSRRAVIAGVGASGLALAVTACGGGTDTAQDAGTTAESSAPESSAPQADGALAKTADVPVGGGTILADQKIVITQPTEGDFKAFSALCTHKGCPVDSVEGGSIVCPCHGSKFAIADGAVTDGPADKPLAAQAIKVDGDQITLA